MCEVDGAGSAVDVADGEREMMMMMVMVMMMIGDAVGWWTVRMCVGGGEWFGRGGSRLGGLFGFGAGGWEVGMGM